MKQIKIECPEGHEIDLEKSNLSIGEIFFKPIKSALPTKWEDFDKKIDGWFINDNSNIIEVKSLPSINDNKNIWPTKELAEAALALCQLIRYKDAWNEGWMAEFTNEENKYVIFNHRNAICKGIATHANYTMIFKSISTRDEFMKQFTDLIQTALPLL